MEGALKSEWGGSITCTFPSELHTLLYDLWMNGKKGSKILEFTGFSGKFYVVDFAPMVYPTGMVGTFDIKSAPMED